MPLEGPSSGLCLDGSGTTLRKFVVAFLHSLGAMPSGVKVASESLIIRGSESRIIQVDSRANVSTCQSAMQATTHVSQVCGDTGLLFLIHASSSCRSRMFIISSDLKESNASVSLAVLVWTICTRSSSCHNCVVLTETLWCDITLYKSRVAT